MTLKGWMLGKVNGTDKRTSRDARARDPVVRSTEATAAQVREPSMRGGTERRGAASDEAEHLGPYRLLITAIREELEEFATTQLRLHLAIAERDRYVLSSIEIECEGADTERELLRRFVREFKPEQIKHYLAKEVIAGLRNASAIDLSQFAGLNAAVQEDDRATDAEEERYGELLAELQGGAPAGAGQPYRVTLVGRWSQLDAPAPVAERGSRRFESGSTPLAARSFAIDVEDARGARRVELASVAPGRRYAIGTGEGCDILVEGRYASRRHCEIWLDKGAWWVADTGSTNGIRIEPAGGGVARRQAGDKVASPLELAPGAWLVLSAHAQGEPRECPRLSLGSAAVEPGLTAGRTTGATPPTPVTPIAPPLRREGALTISARMASGSREVELTRGALPFRIGRSRNQALVIDWAHADVSGRHLEIVTLDESGASVVVHGDNGVTVEGVSHPPGAQFRWKPGETLVLGRTSGPEPSCTLTLSRAA